MTQEKIIQKNLLLLNRFSSKNYEWYLKNINTLSDGNNGRSPLEPVGNVPDAKAYNFATGTCTMYQKGITADDTQI